MEKETKPVDTKESTPPATNAATPEAPVADIQEQNWKKFREQREIERKAKDESDRRANEKEREAMALKAALEAVINKPSPQAQSQPELTDDELLQRKIDAMMSEREKKYLEDRARREHAELPQKLAAAFSDFSEVTNQENLDYLEYHHPEMYAAFKSQPDSFEKFSAVYKAVKRYIPNTQGKKEQAKADRNLAKPQAMSVPGVTPMGDVAPMNLDEARRNANWQRMQRVMKGG